MTAGADNAVEGMAGGGDHAAAVDCATRGSGDAGGGAGRKLVRMQAARLPSPEQAESVAWLSIAERLALDPNADIGKLQQILAMRERIDAKRSEVAYNAAFAEAQAEMAPVAKNKDNKQTNSKYADLAAIADAITPIYTKHGFGMSFSSAPAQDKMVGIKVTTRHRDGFSEVDIYELPLDIAGLAGKVNKTELHAIGSSYSYGRRYAKLMKWDIATEDDDGNAAGKTDAGTISDDELAALKKLIEASEADTGWILERYGITELQYMTKRQLTECNAGLNARLNAARGRSGK